MSENEYKSLQDCFTNATTYNQLMFIIERKIKDMVNTAALVRVDSCTSSGAEAAAGTISATPLVSQIDAEGNAISMVSIPRMPHYRMQAGKAAIVIDPVENDIGVAVFCKADSSAISAGETKTQRPATFRNFDMSDGMYVASVLNTVPSVYIELKQDNTINIKAADGITITADKVKFSGDIEVAGDITAKGDMDIEGDMTASGITYSTHTHTCHDSTTSTPNNGDDTESE